MVDVRFAPRVGPSAEAIRLPLNRAGARAIGSRLARAPDGTRAGPACHADIVLAARMAGKGLLNGNLTLVTTAYDSSQQAGTAYDTAKKTGVAPCTANNPGLGGQTVLYCLEYPQPYFFVGRVAGLVEAYGPLPALLSVLIGAAALAVLTRATARRIRRRDLSP